MKILTDKAPTVNVASILTQDEMAGITEYIHHYPQARAAVLDALKLVQKRNCWVDAAEVAAPTQHHRPAHAGLENPITGRWQQLGYPHRTGD